MSKLKLWKEYPTWEEAEQAWDAEAEQAAKIAPVKKLSVLPDMPGMTADTAKHLKWKSFKWMLFQDHKREVLRGFLKHPFKYGWRYIKSLMKRKSHKRDGDFFLYGVDSISVFQELLKKKNTVFIIGFSYCHKPFECPSGRFTDQCIRDSMNPVCKQCFIGKSVNALPEGREIVPLFIPTVHYIGGKIFEVVHSNPDKQVLFMITACEMTLEMFGDWGNMVNVKGLGVRLDGRICNTMKAFELSERGVKPGLTVVLDATQKRMLEILRDVAEMQ